MSKDTGTRRFLPIKSKTPDEYLRQHKINGLLVKLGVTDEQKDEAHLVASAEAGFSSWPVASKGNWPPNTITAKRAWCALKWLLLDEPKDSKETDEAWKCVNDFLAIKPLEAGLKHHLKGSEGRKIQKEVANSNHKKICAMFDMLGIEQQWGSKEAQVNETADRTNNSPATVWRALKKREGTITGAD